MNEDESVKKLIPAKIKLSKTLSFEEERYIAALEECCENLQEILKAAKARTDYWCTQCTEARALIKQLKQGRK